MPNPYSVYLHDTPSKAVFEKDARAVSHGCIRVQNPPAAAMSTWRCPTRCACTFCTGQRFVGDDGEVQFRRDVYERDAELAAALRR